MDKQIGRLLCHSSFTRSTHSYAYILTSPQDSLGGRVSQVCSAIDSDTRSTIIPHRTALHSTTSHHITSCCIGPHIDRRCLIRVWKDPEDSVSTSTAVSTVCATIYVYACTVLYVEMTSKIQKLDFKTTVGFRSFFFVMKRTCTCVVSAQILDSGMQGTTSTGTVVQ